MLQNNSPNILDPAIEEQGCPRCNSTLEFGEFGLPNFLDATADMVLLMMVVASVSTKVCAGSWLWTGCWMNGLFGWLVNGFPDWPMMGFSPSELKGLDCTGWHSVLVKWTCFSSCLHGGIGGASSFLLHKIVSSWMSTALPLQVFTIPSMKLKAVVLRNFVTRLITFGFWLSTQLFF